MLYSRVVQLRGSTQPVHCALGKTNEERVYEPHAAHHAQPTLPKKQEYLLLLRLPRLPALDLLPLGHVFTHDARGKHGGGGLLLYSKYINRA